MIPVLRFKIQEFRNKEINNFADATVSSGGLLVELWNRQKSERHHLLQRLKTVQTETERLLIFTALYRQCERAKEGLNLSSDTANSITFSASASGVAVAERSQVFDPSRYSIVFNTVRTILICGIMIMTAVLLCIEHVMWQNSVEVASKFQIMLAAPKCAFTTVCSLSLVQFLNRVFVLICWKNIYR